MNPEFFEDVPHIAVNSVRAQAQAGSNELVSMALAEQSQHFVFSLGQTGQLCGGTAIGAGSDGILEIQPGAIGDVPW